MPIVYLRDKSSGRVHQGERRGPSVLTFEACNLDDAGERDEITESELADAEPDRLCRRCFAPAPEPEEAPA